MSGHFSDFFGETEHFSGKNGALSWSILVGKQKHNVQKPSRDTFRDFNLRQLWGTIYKKVRDSAKIKYHRHVY